MSSQNLKFSTEQGRTEYNFLPPLPPSPQTFSLSIGIPTFSSNEVMGTPLNEQNQSFQTSEQVNYSIDSDGYFENQENGMRKEGKDQDGGGHFGKLCSRGHWRPSEDTKLKELVAQYGPQNWNLISEKLEGRSGKSCRLRWFNQLNPRINRRAFSEEEEEKLLAAHRLYGNRWALIARIFPGRTDNAVKNHWHVLMARKTREESNLCKKRKSSTSIDQEALLKSVEMNIKAYKINAFNGSTSSLAESDSTCTNLSLSSSLNPIQPFDIQMGLSNQENMVGFQNYGVGSDNEKLGIFNNNNNDKLYKSASEMMMVMGVGVDQSVFSDSNSEISASESVSKGKNLYVGREIDTKEDGKKSVSFIDFLGVGTI